MQNPVDPTASLLAEGHRVALVAGASRGLGLLIARELRLLGYDVAVCARDEAETKRGAELIRETEPLANAGIIGVHPYACDLADRGQVTDLVQRVEREVGPLDVFIYVAGIIQVGPAEAMTLEHFDDAIGTMLTGPVQAVWTVLPGMRERRHGRIGVVTSIGGKVAPPHLLPYSTAKFGAVGFTEGLAAELQGTGVTATTLVPGLMRTGSQEQALFTGDHGAEYAWFGPAASLPVLAMDAEKAARRMVHGVLKGDPVVLLSPLTQIGTRVHGLMPGVTVRVMGLTNRLLPKAPASEGASRTMTGAEAAKQVTAPIVGKLTALGRKAAEKYNERFAPHERQS